jgi:uncharacterized protein
MNLIRILALALIIWLIYRMIKQWLTNKRDRQVESRKETPAVGKMVKCEQCGLHIPEQEAVQSQGRHFCSIQHRDQFSSK